MDNNLFEEGSVGLFVKHLVNRITPDDLNEAIRDKIHIGTLFLKYFKKETGIEIKALIKVGFRQHWKLFEY